MFVSRGAYIRDFRYKQKIQIKCPTNKRISQEQSNIEVRLNLNIKSLYSVMCNCNNYNFALIVPYRHFLHGSLYLVTPMHLSMQLSYRGWTISFGSLTLFLSHWL